MTSNYDDALSILDGDEDVDTFARDAKGQLPHGLKLIAIEYPVHSWSSLWDAWERKQITKHPVVNSFVAVLQTIGSASYVLSNSLAFFGKKEGVRIRVDIIAAPETIEEWLRPGHGGDQLSRFGLKVSDGDVNVRNYCAESKVVDSLAHRYGYAREEFDDHGGLYFKDAIEEFYDHNEPGQFARWALAAQATDKDFERLAALSDACNGDVTAIEATLTRFEEQPRAQSFLVPGLIPRGAITLLLGNRKVGKSAMALELAVATARREKEWLGFPVDASRGGFAAYMFGEDSAGEVFERVKRMTGGESPYLLHSIPAAGNDLDSALADLAKQKISLLIVDPARKFFQGDEDGSDAVNDFFTGLEAFAMKKDCAVVVTHHLNRNASPRTLADVAAQYRGSSVFLDRPRVTLATLRHGDETHFGIPAPDGVPLHNFRQSEMFAGVRRLRRDDALFRHVPIVTKSAAKEATSSDNSRVLSAVRRMLASGAKLTRTGKAGVFERKPSELAGISRAAVRSAVDALVGQGALVSGSDGALTLPERESVGASLIG